jgi:hypothetical protein
MGGPLCVGFRFYCKLECGGHLGVEKKFQTGNKLQTATWGRPPNGVPPKFLGISLGDIFAPNPLGSQTDVGNLRGYRREQKSVVWDFRLRLCDVPNFFLWGAGGQNPHNKFSPKFSWGYPSRSQTIPENFKEIYSPDFEIFRFPD